MKDKIAAFLTGLVLVLFCCSLTLSILKAVGLIDVTWLVVFLPFVCMIQILGIISFDKLINKIIIHFKENA